MATLLDSFNQFSILNSQYAKINSLSNYCNSLSSLTASFAKGSILFAEAEKLANSPLLDAAKKIAEETTPLLNQLNWINESPMQKRLLEMATIQDKLDQLALPSRLMEEISLSRNNINSILYDYKSPLNAIYDLRGINSFNGFGYEGVFRDKFSSLYRDIPTTSKILLSEDNIFTREEVIVQEQDGYQYFLCNIKDIAGSKIIFPNIDEKEIIDFINFLANTSSLALNHPIGKKVYEYLKSYKNQFLTTLSENELLFRSRENDESGQPFLPAQVIDIPYGVTNTNRFNRAGKIVLYMADNLETANKELKSEKTCTSIKANLNNDIEILDMSDNSNIIFEYCLKPNNELNSTYPRVYLFPNFIADICCNIGIKGIKYKSTLSDGNCYVFFNLHSDSFHKIEYAY